MNLKKLMQFNNPPGKIKNNMTTPHLKKSIGRSPSRLALLLIALVFACLGIRQSAQAGYIVTLQQVGPNVVATGSGAINLHGLTFSHSAFPIESRDNPTLIRGLGWRGHLDGADFFQRGLLPRPRGPTRFRERWLNACQQWQRRHGRDIHGYYSTAFSMFQGAMSPVLFYRTARPTAARLLHPSAYGRAPTYGRGEPERTRTSRFRSLYAAASNWASGRHHQSRNLDRKLCSQPERLGESARIDHQRVFSIWNNEQLRTHYRPAKSHREHLPKYQCAY